MKVTLKYKKAEKRLAKLEDKVAQEGEMTVTELGKLGQNYARAIAYYDTGFTYKSIRRRTIKRVRASRAEIFIEPHIRPVDGVHRRTPGRHPAFNLVRWSHTSPLAQHHFRFSRGDPQFMFSTQRYLQNISGNVARGRFRKIIARI